MEKKGRRDKEMEEQGIEGKLRRQVLRRNVRQWAETVYANDARDRTNALRERAWESEAHGEHARRRRQRSLRRSPARHLCLCSACVGATARRGSCGASCGSHIDLPFSCGANYGVAGASSIRCHLISCGANCGGRCASLIGGILFCGANCGVDGRG